MSIARRRNTTLTSSAVVNEILSDFRAAGKSGVVAWLQKPANRKWALSVADSHLETAKAIHAAVPIPRSANKREREHLDGSAYNWYLGPNKAKVQELLSSLSLPKNVRQKVIQRIFSSHRGSPHSWWSVTFASNVSDGKGGTYVRQSHDLEELAQLAQSPIGQIPNQKAVTNWIIEYINWRAAESKRLLDEMTKPLDVAAIMAGEDSSAPSPHTGPRALGRVLTINQSMRDIHSLIDGSARADIPKGPKPADGFESVTLIKGALKDAFGVILESEGNKVAGTVTQRPSGRYGVSIYPVHASGDTREYISKPVPRVSFKTPAEAILYVVEHAGLPRFSARDRRYAEGEVCSLILAIADMYGRERERQERAYSDPTDNGDEEAPEPTVSAAPTPAAKQSVITSATQERRRQQEKEAAIKYAMNCTHGPMALIRDGLSVRTISGVMGSIHLCTATSYDTLWAEALASLRVLSS